MDEKDLLIQALQQQRDHFLNENVRLTVVANKKIAELEERLKQVTDAKTDDKVVTNGHLEESPKVVFGSHP